MYRATHFEKLIVDTHITRTSLGKCIYAVKSRVGLLQAYCYAGREFTGMQGLPPDKFNVMISEPRATLQGIATW